MDRLSLRNRKVVSLGHSYPQRSHLWVTLLESYKYSSLQDHLGIGRIEGSILDLEAFPQYHSSVEDIQADLQAWQEITPELIKIEEALF